MDRKKLISIVLPCYNEEENIVPMIRRVKEIMTEFESPYNYEIIVIDNSSIDNSVSLIKAECQLDKRIKLIVNSRNFGWVRSPYYAKINATGDAVIYLASDFQDPPELIRDFLKKWEEGFKMVLGIKSESEEGFVMKKIRNTYYDLIGKIADNKIYKNYTGFGLYDKQIIQIFKSLEDPYPYFRGLVSEVGFSKAFVEFKQPTRKRGISSGNFFALYDMAMLGITSYSKIPLRVATLIGFSMSALSLLISIFYLVLKLTFWYNFPAGNAPTVIGIFFIGSVQLFFIGILGEYIGSIHTIVQKRPLVIELERVNFEE